MTDLAKAKDAASLCKQYLIDAVDAWPNNIDAYYQVINYHLETDNPELAEETADKLMTIYKEKTQENDEAFFNEFADQTYHGLVKILIEL